MTCTEFIAMLDDMIDDSIAAETRAEVEKHMHKCGHCEVVFNTTRKTIEIYRNSELYELPDDLRGRLQSAIMTKCSAHKDKKAGPQKA